MLLLLWWCCCCVIVVVDVVVVVVDVVDDVIVVVEGVCNDLGFKRGMNPVFLHCSGGILSITLSILRI